MTDYIQQPFWEQTGHPAPGTHMTYNDFRTLPETNIPVELVHNTVIYPHWNEHTMTAAPVPTHQEVVGVIHVWLFAHARQHGGKVYMAPSDVVLGDNVVQPDVMWLAENSQCARTPTNFNGAPELVVEVISPGTAKRDRESKR
ncbi:MAG: Uma2 family endonuclease, partial [Chloroflexota bacterium]